MTYTDFIRGQLQKYAPGQPIYASLLAREMEKHFGISEKKAGAAVAVTVSRIMANRDDQKLRTFQKGIYYLTEETPFGVIDIDKDQLIFEKYLFSSHGYESGLGFLNRLGLTTQMPKTRDVVTNHATDGTRWDEKLGVRIHPAKTPVTPENKPYLQILDAMEIMKKAPVDAENPYRIFARFIDENALNYQTLLSLAGSYYSQTTLKILAKTAMQKETTS